MRRVGPNLVTPRCFECGVHRKDCLCAELPRRSTRTPILFLQHVQELQKPTNSARLACRVLESASIVAWERTAPPDFGAEPIVLYPLAGSSVLTAEDLADGSLVVIPDGTWGQASRIANVLGKRRIRSRVLPMGNRSLWAVRHCADTERISSAQAAAAVLAIAGESEAATTLLDTLSEVGRRILALRGIVASFPDESRELPTRPG